MNTEIERPIEEEELPEDAAADEGGEEELSYDEEGNVIIPEGEEEPEEEPEEGEDEEEPEEEEEGEGEEPTAEEPTEEPAEAEEENAEEEAKKAEEERRARRMKAALKKLGLKGDIADALDGLETLAAESEGKSLEDYRKENRDREEAEEAKAFVRKQAYENMKKADLAALHAAYPETAELADVEKMENFKRFAELRDAGLSVKEAYAAANPEAIRKSAAETGKKNSLKGTKAHMASVVPKGAAGDSTEMSPKEMKEWREMFPGKSKKEILALYKRATS